MFFNSQFYDNTQIQGFAVLEQVNTGDKTRQFATLKETLLEGEVSGPVADLLLTQIFSFQCVETEIDEPIEAIYRFPLPGDAAVNKVSVKFRDVEIRTTLLSRKKAEENYKEASNTYRQAAMLIRESPDIFTLLINGIKPGEEVKIKTSFVLAGSSNKIGFSFRIPLTTAPKYVFKDEIHSSHTIGNQLITIQNPLQRFSIRLRSLGAGSLESPTHQISKKDGYYLLTSGKVIPDKDFGLIYRPFPNLDQISLKIFSSGGDDPCLLALVTPPVESSPRIPLDVIVLVDHSGSMSGCKQRSADQAIKQYLNRFSPDDLFNLCLFDDRQYWYAENPVPANIINRDNAIEFLKNKHTGGTKLGDAIEQALFQNRSKDPVSRHLLIITDAEVADFGRINSLIDEESERIDKRRCSIICIDSSPNFLLAKRIADKTGGISMYLTSKSGEGNITDAINDALSSWEHIIAEGVLLSVNRSLVITSRRTKSSEGSSLIEIPPVGLSRSSWIMLKTFHESDPITCSLILPDGSKIISEIYEIPVIRSLVGAWIIQELELLMHSYPTDDTIPKND